MERRKLRDWCENCQYRFRLNYDVMAACVKCMRNYIGLETEIWRPPGYKEKCEE